jgi:hypothetical protein
MIPVNTTTQQLKHDYLAAMGVTPWFPRVILANAPMPLLQSISSLDPVHLEQQPRLDSQAVIQPGAQAEPLAQRTPVDAVQVPVSSVAPVPDSGATPASDGEAPIRFGLGIYVLGDWLVVSSLVSGHEDSQDGAFRLINAILKAMTGNDYEMKHHHVIAWPFFTNANADQGIKAAQEYVSGVLQQRAEEHHTANLLVLGGVMSKLSGWQSAEGTEYGMKRLVLPSVYRMMSEPMQKAKAWQLIRSAGYGQ